MRLHKLIPVLRSFDEAAAKDFYLRYLGFDLQFEYRHEPGLPLYFGASRNGVVLHISEHHGDACPGTTIRIETEGLDVYHAELQERGHKRLNPGLLDQPWGYREMAITDPFGNRLVFCEEV